jgi:uncharacterized protein YjbI with pentapeptide repeats
MNLKISCLLTVLAIPYFEGMAQAANPNHVSQLLSDKQCNGCDLSQADLSSQDLSGVQLVGANLNGANLVGTNLSGANLTEASIVGANLATANLNKTNLTKTTFVYSNLAQTQMQGAKLLQTDFQGANLAGMDLSGSQIRKSSFARANSYGLKLPSSIRTTTTGLDSDGNTFAVYTLGSLLGEGEAPRTVTIESGAETYESGTTYRRRIRKYAVPQWISTTQRSVPGGSLLYNPNDLNLMIELW